MAISDVPFDADPDPTSIRWRLHPLDVGFDLRSDRLVIDMRDAEDPLRVSYPDAHHERRVMSGPRAEIVALLRTLGFEVLI